MVDLTDSEMSDDMDHTAGHLIDLTSPPSAQSPASEAEQEEDQDVQVVQATAGILDKIVGNEFAWDDSDNDSLCSRESDIEGASINLSDDDASDSTDSELGMEELEDDRSDDDEGSNSDDEKADWDAEYSSDDDILDEGMSRRTLTTPESSC